jgi:hypothetical protein
MFQQILPSQKEKENPIGKGFGKVIRPRAALGDIGNKTLNDQKVRRLFKITS